MALGDVESAHLVAVTAECFGVVAQPTADDQSALVAAFGACVEPRGQCRVRAHQHPRDGLEVAARSNVDLLETDLGFDLSHTSECRHA